MLLKRSCPFYVDVFIRIVSVMRIVVSKSWRLVGYNFSKSTLSLRNNGFFFSVDELHALLEFNLIHRYKDHPLNNKNYNLSRII